ncbi:MAG: cation diffusion facilitator family transporter [Akkermansiaceae bacterium]
MTTETAYREQMAIMLISLAVAVILLGLKAWAAWTTHSSALYSDAAESFVHLIAVIIAVRALQLSHKPADNDHHFGHDKAAFLSAGFEGAMISSAALFIYFEAARQFQHGVKIEKIGFGALLAGAATAVNLLLGAALLQIGKKRHSPVLRANGHHVMTDVYTSVGVLVALALVFFTGWPWWDPLIAVIAATNILWTGIKLVRSSLDGLMDAAEPETEARIRKLLDALMQDFDFSYHHLRHRHSGHTHWVELHLVFEDETTVHDAHEVATRVEAEICSLLAPYGRIITHLEPRSAEEKDEVWEGARA